MWFCAWGQHGRKNDDGRKRNTKTTPPGNADHAISRLEVVKMDATGHGRALWAVATDGQADLVTGEAMPLHASSTCWS